jgi:hypothetical protein
MRIARPSGERALLVHCWIIILACVAAQKARATEPATGGRALLETERSGEADRVFSRTNPLFGRSIPQATADSDGDTRVVVKPLQEAAKPVLQSEPDRSQAGPAAASSGAAKASDAEAGQVVPLAATQAVTIINRADVDTKQKADQVLSERPRDAVGASLAGHREQNLGRTSVSAPFVAARPERPSRREVIPPLPVRGTFDVTSGPMSVSHSQPAGLGAAGAVLPERNPSALLARMAGANRSLNERGIAGRAALRSRRVASRKSLAPQRRTSRRRVKREVHRRAALRRQNERPAGRRHSAPPGTVATIVRCWPGDPCVRYYKVRRPRTYEQYRQLVAWQRRMRAQRYQALRGRRY